MNEFSLSRCRNILEIIVCALESIVNLKIGVLEDLLLNMIKSLPVYNDIPSLSWGLQVRSGEILEACSAKQELNQNVAYRYSYLT